MLTFRPVQTREDWRIATEIRNQNWPAPWAVEEAIEFHENTPVEHQAERLLGSVDGIDVAYLIIQQAFWYKDAGRFECRQFTIASNSSPELVDSVIQELIHRTRNRGALRMACWQRDDQPLQMKRLETAGFKPGQRNPESRLNVQNFDEAEFGSLIAKLESDGYEFASLSELKSQYDDWMQRAYRLEMDLMADVPLPEPWEDLPFETFEKDLRSEFMDLDLCLFALHQNEWVGQTRLHPNHVDSSLMSTGLTGVRRNHRRRGLALALKSLSLASAKSKGVSKVTTDNEEDNPMFQINLKLGFEKLFDWVCLEIDLA